MSEHRLYTACWSRALKHGGDDIVIVRTSIGKPRWVSKTVMDHLPAVKELMPWGLLSRDIPFDEFVVRYRRRLDEVGVDLLNDIFEDLERRNPGRGLVLVCFEGNPLECHRSVFARWWLEQTGELIPEFPGGATHHLTGTAPEPPAAAEPVQETLI